jgi:hypothetical protein
MSWRPEVQTDLTGQWHGNGLRFLTHKEAEATARNLMRRWLSVRSARAVECVDPVNYHYIEGRLKAASAVLYLCHGQWQPVGPRECKARTT